MNVMKGCTSSCVWLCECTILYKVIKKIHKASPNAPHWVLYYPHCCRCDLALLFTSLVSSRVRTFEVAV